MPQHKRVATKAFKPSWPVTYRWVAAGTLAIYSAIGCQKVAAFQPPASANAARQWAKRFDIPAGPLGEVTRALEADAGISVTLSAPAIAELPSPGVRGLYTTDLALDLLLNNTGVRWRSTGPQSVVLEGGAKWDLPAHRLSLRAALFSTTKTNAREPDPTNPLLNVLAGDQRVNGFQFEATSHVTRRWELRTSYAYLDGKVVSSQYYPASIGAQLANVPRDTYNIWNTWRLPRHWEAGFGGNFVSSRTASSTVPLDPVTGLVKKVSSYWVFNAMLEHPLNEHIGIQANAYNLANRYYYDELHPAHIVLGPGRSVLIGLKFKF